MEIKIEVGDNPKSTKYRGEINCPNCSKRIELELGLWGSEPKIEDEVLKNTVCNGCKKNIWRYSKQERTKIKAARLSQPQFINGEGRSFSDRAAVEDAIKKSIKQFRRGESNLLIVTLNMFAGSGYGLLASMNGGSAIKQVVTKYDKEGLITCVCLLDVQLKIKDFEYTSVFIAIKRAVVLSF